jgi:hypothetical protein
MQVLFPPNGPGDPDYAPVQTYLMNNPSVTGAVIAVEWSDFDMGNGLYDFTITDNTLQPWINAGKKVNLVLHNTSYGSSFCPGTGVGSNGTVASNCAVPRWMWTALGREIKSVSVCFLVQLAVIHNIRSDLFSRIQNRENIVRGISHTSVITGAGDRVHVELTREGSRTKILPGPQEMKVGAGIV